MRILAWQLWFCQVLFTARLLASLANYIYVVVNEIYLISGPDFFAFAGLDLAIDTDQSIGNCLFGVATAVAEPFEFENFVQFDKFGFEFRDDFVWITHNIIICL